MAPTYKVTYFPIRGLGEILRMLLKAGKIDFDDERISNDDWPKLKESMPFGELPVLTINGKIYHQHLALARFLGNQINLTGVDDFENLDIDMVADTMNDLKTKARACFTTEDETKRENLKKTFFNETLPYYFERLDKIANENNGHLACKRLTWVDIYFTGITDVFISRAGGNFIDKYANLAAVRKNVLEVKEIKEWIKVRPKTDI